MKLYYVFYEIVKDRQTGETVRLVAGPYNEEEVLDQFRNVKRTAGVFDAYISENKQ